MQLLARAVLAYRSALAGGLPQPPPVKLGAGTSTSGGSGSQTSPAAHNSNTTIEERQDEARLYFALASAQFTLSEQFAPPPAPAADATDATDEDADGAGAGAGDSALASAPTPAAPSAHSAASMPKAPTASAWWLPLLDAPDLFAPSPSDAAPHSKSSSAASSAPAASAAAVGGPLSADIVEAESAMTALIASRLGTGTGGARLDPEAQAALLFAAERSMRVAASCALQVCTISTA